MKLFLFILAAFVSVSNAWAQESESVVIAGQPSVAELDSLKSLGFEAVLSTRGKEELDWDEAGVVDSLGMTFVHIPMENPVDTIDHEQLTAFDAFMALEKKSFLHCGSGNRVAGLWAAWLVEYHDVDPEEALARAEAFGLRPQLRSIVEAHLQSHDGPEID
jgi:protein tyrosine phosphatase (PTP) superfamily phosphohydrolase (DUF442 family)